MSNAWHSMRASDTDRDRAADIIKAAFAEGRITSDEHAERLQQIMHARTYGELQRLVVDLPSGGLSPSAASAPPAVPDGGRWGGPPAPVQQPTNDLALASMICGGLGFMTGITAVPAIITGHMALSRIKESGQDGRGLAIAGLIMGYAITGTVVLAILMVLGLTVAVTGL